MRLLQSLGKGLAWAITVAVVGFALVVFLQLPRRPVVRSRVGQPPVMAHWAPT